MANKPAAKSARAQSKAHASEGIRLPNGEWRPSYPVRYAPVFAWPPQPLAVAKWCLSYPGFLWPWNSIWLAITLITWFYFQPPTDAFVNIWSEAARSAALFMYARNLILLWLTAGGWHAVLYTLKLNGSHQKYYPEWQAHNNPKFMFSNQVYDNIFWSCVSGCTIWTAYEVWYFHLLAHGLVPALGWQSKPWTCAAWLCAIPFWRELHFYAVHRLIHWKPLYNTVHYLHHKNFNPGPWSGMAMHPVEHLFYFSVLLIHWFVPSHPIHFLFNAQHTALTPAGGHHGFEGPILEGKVPTGSYFHYLHHRYFECNYGEATLPLDWLFGTFRDGLPEGQGSGLQGVEHGKAQ